MTEISETTVLRRRLSVAHQLQEAKQLAVFDDARSELVLLNEMGAAVWSTLDGASNLGEIATDIAEVVPGAPERSEVIRIVLHFASELVERGAVEVVEP